ncbi:MAG TPA: RNA polymerase subunit sigma-24 [Verrucomicrobiales bacterium]|nr:RNA polymerase subunit sigma-24 [Verrucomicrobiales bacterium]
MTVANVTRAEPGEPPPEPLEALFAALESPLLAYAMKLVQQSETAQDLVQEAFIRLHGDFANVRQPRAWLYRTVHNLAANHHRKQRKIVPLARDADGGEIEWPDDAPTPDQALHRLEATDQTRRCLATLDERSRHLIRLKFEEHHSYRRISELTGISIGNVGYILHHALKQLADELKKLGVTP